MSLQDLRQLTFLVDHNSGEAFVGYVKGHDLPFYLEARAD